MKKLILLFTMLIVSLAINAQATPPAVELDSAILVTVEDGLFADYVFRYYENDTVIYAITDLGSFPVADSSHIISQFLAERDNLYQIYKQDSTALSRIDRNIYFYNEMKKELKGIISRMDQ